ncbi:phosphotransferase enzyme family protein [Alkaliphilus transvaalensis]|uniref:phosphotransferase enzyme family protein n=1 Tax=Alkaliphilus transvaalensis TaxID=114628 RepID=UPI0004799832|nr:phosphotransferase [Alkaliphilus transvaalensis]
MLKLKCFFDNKDLAKMILENWEYDLASIDMFNFYRISSNAVYPFKYKGKTRFLRFSPVGEKDINNLVGELDFIRFLMSRDYPALSIIVSKNNEEFIEVYTPWGDFYAVVFERVDGVQLGEIEYTPEICKKHGSYLGKLHKLSSDYKPITKLRWTYEDVFLWIDKELSNLSYDISAIEEIKILETYLSKIPKNEKNFGLIHYDFELDNVFYDQAKDVLNIIDFDDAMYHWYAMDIERALDSIKNEIPKENYFLMKDSFIKGYNEEFNVTDEMLSYLPIFRRFANLYAYTRILRSTAEVWNNEPDWLTEIRGKLNIAMEQRSKFFGKPIQ